MADTFIREYVASLPVPEFDEPAFNDAPVAAEATVAIVTTAGLVHPGDGPWAAGDESYRVYDASDRDLTLGHFSPNFDRTGIALDLNVAYPADRLDEMADEGRIGGVGPHHVSFMGALDERLTTIRMDTGPAAAKQLRDDGVDVVLLTPI